MIYHKTKMIYIKWNNAFHAVRHKEIELQKNKKCKSINMNIDKIKTTTILYYSKKNNKHLKIINSFHFLNQLIMLKKMKNKALKT